LIARVCAIAGDFTPSESIAPVAAEYFSSERRSIEWRLVELLLWQVICASSPQDARFHAVID
jgi:hypothetical protein